MEVFVCDYEMTFVKYLSELISVTAEPISIWDFQQMVNCHLKPIFCPRNLR